MLTLEDVRKNAENLNPIDDKGIIAIVQNWGNELIKQLQNNLLKNKTNASSGLSESIDPKITQPPSGYNLSIMMEDYWFMWRTAERQVRCHLYKISLSGLKTNAVSK
jgi:hypothetical protein